MYWRPYVPVAQRRAQAQKKLEALRKKGMNVQPVEVEGRTIARSFWGKGWCEHLESFSDFSNRLPRGRTYVRNGSVCHLDMQPGNISAMVSGSQLYRVSIVIQPLSSSKWKAIKTACAGHIGSMLELLQGRLSDQVMAIVTDRAEGLFPKPNEITLTCSCPDWATMCKHVAAVLYGVGNRLDTYPELLFLLRGVDAQELIASDFAMPTAGAETDAVIDDDELSSIFGIDLDEDTPAATELDTTQTLNAPDEQQKSQKQSPSKRSTKARAKSPGTKSKTTRKAKSRTANRKKAPQISSKPENPPTITGKFIADLRQRYGFTVQEFADALTATPATIYRWESIRGPVKVQERFRRKLIRLWKAI